MMNACMEISDNQRGDASVAEQTTILIVDDEEAILELGTFMLQRIGFDVLTALSGEQCLEVLEAHSDSISCVLMDLTMPGMNGIQTLDRVRAISPGIQVFLTSGYDCQDMVNDPSATFDGYIQKPFSLTSLRQALEDQAANNLH